jgi:chromosome segregation ATPase
VGTPGAPRCAYPGCERTALAKRDGKGWQSYCQQPDEPGGRRHDRVARYQLSLSTANDTASQSAAVLLAERDTAAELQRPVSYANAGLRQTLTNFADLATHHALHAERLAATVVEQLSTIESAEAIEVELSAKDREYRADLALKTAQIAQLEQLVGVHDNATREANVAAEAATGLAESLNRQLDNAQAQLADLTSERDTLTGSLTDAAAARDTAQGRVTELNSDLATLRTELTALRAELDHTSNELTNERSSHQVTSAALTDARSTISVAHEAQRNAETAAQQAGEARSLAEAASAVAAKQAAEAERRAQQTNERATQTIAQARDAQRSSEERSDAAIARAEDNARRADERAEAADRRADERSKAADAAQTALTAALRNFQATPPHPKPQTRRKNP